MMNKILISALCAVFSLVAEEVHEFSGKHFVASYLHCDPRAICNLQELIEAMDQAVNASGAQVLEKKSYVFPPHGLTIVYLLAESHASLHTYPEFESCFIDLFTCGNNCSSTSFDAALRAYLKPKEVNARLFLRNAETVEVPYDLANDPLYSLQ